MKAFVAFTTAALLASAAAPADAARIRYRYDGVVTVVDTNENNVLPTVVPGSTLTGSLWFDDTVADTSTLPSFGEYHQPAFVDATINGTYYSFHGETVYIRVSDAATDAFSVAADAFFPSPVSTPTGFSYVNFGPRLTDTTGAALISDDLPLNARRDQFTSGAWKFIGQQNDNSFWVEGVVTTFRRIATLADMEFDGYSDIILSRGQHSFVWSMRGARRDGERLLTSQHTRFQVRGVGDVDGDGDSDIVWYDKQTCTARLGLLDDAVLVSKRFVGPAMGGNWELVAVGDFVGDDLAELVWRNRVTGQNRVWQTNGVSVTASSNLPTIANTAWRIGGIGDSDGDNKGDVFWQNTISGQLMRWTMAGAAVRERHMLTGGPAFTKWKLEGVGDYDGDGDVELLFFAPATRQLGIALVNGSTLSPLIPITARPSAGYSPVGGTLVP